MDADGEILAAGGERVAKKQWTAEELKALPMERLEKLLTDRQTLFVFEYLRDFNGTKAAERAGYEPKSAASQAWKLLRRPEIKEYRDRKVREIFESKGITPEFIQLSCFEIYCRCMEKEPVVEWDSAAREWKPSGTWQFDARGALRALDQMAAILGMKRPEAEKKAPAESVEQFLARTGGNERKF